MPRRYRPPGHRGELIDLDTARAAIERVATERDALAHQLTRAQDTIRALQRQLEARRSEADHLARALRTLEARHARHEDAAELERVKRIAEQAQEEAAQWRAKADAAQERLERLQLECEAALAERDSERAARHELEVKLADLREARPDGDRAQRLAADLANLRRHRDEAIAQGIRAGTTRLLTEIASIRDSVERALQACPEPSGPFHDGLLAILSKVDNVFAHEGATPLGRVGERFDPAIHEAVGTVQGSPPDMVHAVVSTGVMLDDGTVAVPARVIVTREEAP